MFIALADAVVLLITRAGSTISSVRGAFQYARYPCTLSSTSRTTSGTLALYGATGPFPWSASAVYSVAQSRIGSILTSASPIESVMSLSSTRSNFCMVYTTSWIFPQKHRIGAEGFNSSEIVRAVYDFAYVHSSRRNDQDPTSISVFPAAKA